MNRSNKSLNLGKVVIEVDDGGLRVDAALLADVGQLRGGLMRPDVRQRHDLLEAEMRAADEALVPDRLVRVTSSHSFDARQVALRTPKESFKSSVSEVKPQTMDSKVPPLPAVHPAPRLTTVVLHSAGDQQRHQPSL